MNLPDPAETTAGVRQLSQATINGGLIEPKRFQGISHIGVGLRKPYRGQLLDHSHTSGCATKAGVADHRLHISQRQRRLWTLHTIPGVFPCHNVWPASPIPKDDGRT